MVSIADVEQGRVELQEPAVSGLADAELFGLRLAAQVLGHKAALAGRPRVARWFADLESLIAFRLASRGVGVVLGAEPRLALAPDADAADRRLLAEYLGLLADNEGLTKAQRETCRALRAASAE